MFVQENTWNGIQAYFKSELGNKFSSRELKLILKTLYCKRFLITETDYLLIKDERLSESDLLYFHGSLKRMRSNEPFQYVVGETEFYGLNLKCDPRALIPRPETEELVDWIVSSNHEKKVFVDLCSGSGCIALGLKSALPQSKIYAVEYSSGAVELIKDNIKETELEINVIEADVLKNFFYDTIEAKVDIIVSNPPYIPLKDKVQMESNVLDFEPEMALFVENDDPLIFYREIIKNGKRILSSNGWIYFEIHEDLAADVIELFEKEDFVNIELRKDLQGKDRMVRGQVVNWGL